MIETSQDLLYIVLSFCIIWLTVFISWAIYYLVMILRQSNQVMAEFREKAGMVSAAVLAIKERLEHSASYLGVLSKAVEKIMEYAQRKKKVKKE